MLSRKIIVLFCIFLLLPTIATSSPYSKSWSEIPLPPLTTEKFPVTLSNDIYQNQDLPFNTYEGPGAFDSYLVMNVRFEPIAEVLTQIRQAVYPNLINRGEAHITVITPPEYMVSLKSKLTMKEINQIARENDIQKSRINILGVGSGRISVEGKTQETFFLLAQSEDLLQLRREIYKAFVAKGGDPKAFDPEHFFPHITIGFTKRDLHETDGVIKDVQHSLDLRFPLMQ